MIKIVPYGLQKLHISLFVPICGCYVIVVEFVIEVEKNSKNSVGHDAKQSVQIIAQELPWLRLKHCLRLIFGK